MSLRTAPHLGEATVAAALSAWFHTPPGRFVAGLERHLLGAALPDLFGYHAVMLGNHVDDDLLAASRISHRVRVSLAGTTTSGATELRCAEDALPLAAGTIDVLVLPHVLEYAEDPRRVLREVERVLIGEGHVVVVGFNPFSLFGLWSVLLRWQGRAPWNGRFISTRRLKDWLQLLGFDIVQVARAGFRPPLRRTRLARYSAFVERLGAFCWPACGNVYLVVGKKRVEAVTPLRVSWRQRRRLLAGGVVEPSTRQLTPRRVPGAPA